MTLPQQHPSIDDKQISINTTQTQHTLAACKILCIFTVQPDQNLASKEMEVVEIPRLSKILEPDNSDCNSAFISRSKMHVM